MTGPVPGERRNAGNMVVLLAVIVAIICIVVGVVDLARGRATGWLLIVLGVLPLLIAGYTRARLMGSRGKPGL